MTPEALIEKWREKASKAMAEADVNNQAERIVLAARHHHTAMTLKSCADELSAALAGERETAGDRELRLCLQDLYALVQGECPSLLDEDSGGCAYLALRIEKALAPVSPSRERPE